MEREDNIDIDGIKSNYKSGELSFYLGSAFDGSIRITGNQEGGNDTNCLYCKTKLCEPRLLPCFHVFCSKCIQSCINNSPFDTKFLCPLCEIPILASRKDGATRFAKFTYLDESNIPSKNRDPIVCGACEEAMAVSTCLSCNESYCPSCQYAHVKMKFSKHHRFVHVERTPAGNARSKALCPAHQSEEMAVFCKGCKQSFCSVCTLKDHSSHESVNLEETAIETRQQLQSMSSANFDFAKNAINSRCEDIETEIQTISSNINDGIKAYKNHVNDLKSELDVVKADYAEKMKKEQKEQNRSLDLKQDTLQAQLKAIHLQKRTISKILEHGSDRDVLEQYKGIKSMTCGKDMSSGFELFEWEEMTFKRPDMVEFQRTVKANCGELLLTEELNSPVVLECSEFDVSKFGYETPVGICPVSDSSVLLIFKTHVQLCNKGHSRKKANNITEKVYDITKDNYENVYIACESSLQRMDAKGQKAEQIQLPRKTPSGLAANAGVVLVAFFHDEVLIEYHHTTREWTEKKVPIRPNKLAVNKRGDIFISEGTSGVLLSENFEARCTIALPETAAVNFRGLYAATSRAYQGVSLTDSGFIVISDYYTKNAFIYSDSGKLLRTVCLSYLGSYPTCSAVDDHGFIWVGAYKGNIQRYSLETAI